jgi:hypothetical protein
VVGVGFLFTRKDRTGPTPSSVASGEQEQTASGRRWAPIPTPPALHTLGSG